MPIDGGKNTIAEIAAGVDASTKVDAVEALLITKLVTKTFTFTGAAGFGQANDTINLFTVTAGVDISFEAFPTTNLTVSAGTTLEIGFAGDTADLIAQTDPTTIDAGEVWHDATPDKKHELTSDASKDRVLNGDNIIATVGAGGNITAGVITFSVLYTPRTSGALVEAA